MLAQERDGGPAEGVDRPLRRARVLPVAERDPEPVDQTVEHVEGDLVVEAGQVSDPVALLGPGLRDRRGEGVVGPGELAESQPHPDRAASLLAVGQQRREGTVPPTPAAEVAGRSHTGPGPDAHQLHQPLPSAEVVQHGARAEVGLGRDPAQRQGLHPVTRHQPRHGGRELLDAVGGVEDPGHDVIPARSDAARRRLSTGPVATGRLSTGRLAAGRPSWPPVARRAVRGERPRVERTFDQPVSDSPAKTERQSGPTGSEPRGGALQSCRDVERTFDQPGSDSPAKRERQTTPTAATQGRTAPVTPTR